MTASLINGTLATGILAADRAWKMSSRVPTRNWAAGLIRPKLLAVICAIGGAIVLLVFLSAAARTARRDVAQDAASPGEADPGSPEGRAPQARRNPPAQNAGRLARRPEPAHAAPVPSLLAKAAKERPDKLDRRVVSGMIKRMT
jgi:hypothetical protein